MIAHLLWLQFALLYLPLLAASLAIYGADFEHASGDLYLWTPAVVAALHFVLRAFGRPLARREVAGPILIACAVVVAIAYRPLHMSWWDERSTQQAVRVLLVGVASVTAAAIGAFRVADQGGPRAGRSARAVLALAAAGCTTLLYPLMPLLTLAVMYAAGAAASDRDDAPPAPRPHLTPFGGRHRYALLLFALELSLPLWDLQTDARWGAFYGAGLAGFALGVLATRRFPVTAALLPALGALAVAASVVDSRLVVCPFTTVLVGAAAGWVAFPVLDADPRDGRPAGLRWITPLWILGFVMGFALSGNRAFLELRALLWLPFLLRWIPLPRAARTS